MNLQMPMPISGGLILSYKCNASCRHCMYACSPGWSNIWITEKNLNQILRQLAKTIQASPYGPDTVTLSHGLHFTGGEPFLNFNLLLQAVKESEDLRIPSTFVETNCFWCTSDEVTRDKLHLLKGAGLKGILISVNPFYLEYVPFERTRRCIRIGLEIFGQNTLVYQLEYFQRFCHLKISGRLSIEDYIQREGNNYFLRNAEFFLMGRAPYRLNSSLFQYFDRQTAAFFFTQPCVPEFLRKWHNHFDNYGNYIPGFCGGITLGNCFKLDEILQTGIDLDQFPVLRFIVKKDFEGLFRFAVDFGYKSCREGYYSKCHLCVDIRKYLVFRGQFHELQPKEYYSHLK